MDHYDLIMLNYGDDSSGFCTDIKICVTNDFTNYLYCMDLQLHFKTVKLCKIDQFDPFYCVLNK